MEKQILPAFPTLIGRFTFPNAAEVNRRLREVVLERERSTPGIQVANVGNWHSTTDLLEWPDPAVATLRGWITEAIQQMIHATIEQMRAGGLNRGFNGGLRLQAWANVNRDGQYHSLHNHPRSAWSGVYYVATGETDRAKHPNSGVIDLHDPRPFTEMTFVPGEPYGQKLSVRPEPGLMLLFPGFLYHFVHPFHGTGERISIAFNSQAQPTRA